MKTWVKGGLILVAIFTVIGIGNYILAHGQNEGLAYLPFILANGPGSMISTIIIRPFINLNSFPQTAYTLIGFFFSAIVYFFIGAGIGNMLDKTKRKEEIR